MSILIKGMTIPRSCDECQFSVDEGRFCVAAQKIIPIVGSVGWCPLIEIPPHGRLVDADELDKQMVSEIASGITILYDNLVEWISSYIDNAPTVIEADKDAYEEAMEEFRKNPKTYTLDEIEEIIEGREHED